MPNLALLYLKFDVVAVNNDVANTKLDVAYLMHDGFLIV